MKNKEKREELNKTFRCREEFKIEEEHKEFLSLFPLYKEVLEKHKDEELFFYDCGNDYRTDWAIGHKRQIVSTANTDYKYYSYTQLCYYQDHILENKILKLYPKCKKELEFEIKEKEDKKIKNKKVKESWFKVTCDGEDKFKFGKYKGVKVIDVLKSDEKYINWCLESISEFPEYLKLIKEKITL